MDLFRKIHCGFNLPKVPKVPMYPRHPFLAAGTLALGGGWNLDGEFLEVLLQPSTTAFAKTHHNTSRNRQLGGV